MYLDFEETLINEHFQHPFAIVVCDVNELKRINDEEGHQAGDQYLIDACKIICGIFEHSPVFRIGGDEFVAVCQGQDYDQLDSLIGKMALHNIQAKNSGDIVIACGVAKYEQDESAQVVFNRADRSMYVNKNLFNKWWCILTIHRLFLTKLPIQLKL